ncbi:hypothetical protein QR685DRAFT_534469 [Neurospora intermedia]|uniref:Secreted protein n=1 Tax=Neurospora intermedia TaxID=5142 RepID=A0ABR3D281_NEUIN
MGALRSHGNCRLRNVATFFFFFAGAASGDGVAVAFMFYCSTFSCRREAFVDAEQRALLRPSRLWTKDTGPMNGICKMSSALRLDTVL